MGALSHSVISLDLLSQFAAGSDNFPILAEINIFRDIYQVFQHPTDWGGDSANDLTDASQIVSQPLFPL
jgi:hypothetical protein